MIPKCERAGTRRRLWLKDGHCSVYPSSQRLFSTTERTGAQKQQLQAALVDLQRRSKDHPDDKQTLEGLIGEWAAILKQRSKNLRDEKQTLEGWAALLKQQSDPGPSLNPVETLFQLWKNLPNTDCNTPFRNMLAIYSDYCPSGSKALQVLLDWENSSLAGDMSLQCQEEHYVQVLEAYSKTNEPNVADVTEELIYYLEQSWKGGIFPNIHHYGMAVSNVKKGVTGTDRDKDIQLYRLLEQYMDKILVKLDVNDRLHKETLAKALCDAFHSHQSVFASVRSDPESQRRLWKWCQQWTRLVDEATTWEASSKILEETSHSMLKLLHERFLSHNNETPGKRLDHVEAMTQLVLQLYDTKDRPFLPSSRNYLEAIRAWGHYADTIDRSVGKQQQNLLLKCLSDQFHETIREYQAPLEKTHFWNGLMEACVEVGEADLVKAMWDDNVAKRADDPTKIRRNQQSYTILLQSLAAKRDRDSPVQSQARATKAHSILQKMLKYDKAKRMYEPHIRHFEFVLLAWSRSRHGKAALHAQEVFQQISEQGLEPMSGHYQLLITAWGYSRLDGALDRVLQLYEEMRARNIPVDFATYTTILFALSRQRSKAAAVQAEELLQEMIEKSKEPGGESLKPTLACYNSVMYAWHHIPGAEAFERCKNLYQTISSTYKDSGFDPACQPDCTTFATLIDAAAGNGEMGEFADRVLDEIEQQAAKGRAKRPNSRVYTSVMKAHWKDGLPDAGVRAGRVFERMKVAHQSGNVDAKPDAHTMTVLLSAWAISRAPNKASVAWDILNEMHEAFDNGDIDMLANQYTYTAALNACAFTKSDDPQDHNKAVELAFKILHDLESQKIKNGLSPYTFRNLFEVISNQIEDSTERSKQIGRVFELCCKSGYVNKFAVKVLMRYAPSLYHRLHDSTSKQLNLPSKWTRNVPNADRYVGRQSFAS